MPKPPNPKNKGLPTRWRYLHGAYYYKVPTGMEYLWDGKQLFRLGKTLPEAYRVWAQRLEKLDTAKTIGHLLDRYALEVLPEKAAATRTGYARHIQRLRAVFGAMPLASIEPRHIYEYVDKRGKRVAAHREVSVLSHAYTKAVEWGYLNRHPFKNEVRLTGEKPRTRYVTDEELIQCLALPATRKKGSITAVQAFIRLTLLTGLRRTDLLNLRTTQITDDGIHITTSKTKRPMVYEWSDELRTAVETAKDARPVHISPFLFCTRRGEGYVDETTGTASGWDSIWQRFMDRVLAETEVTERFTAHDIRAKAGSDATTLEHARALLAHADSRVTRKHYRRKPERVKPLK